MTQRGAGPMMPLVAGIDIGTTSTKVGLYGLDGTLVASGKRPTAAAAEAVVADVLALLRSVVSAGPPVAIGISSMAETGVALDARLRPLHPLLRWNDPGGIVEAERVAVEVGARTLWRVSGVNLASKTPLARWLGLRGTSPDILDHMRTWASMADLVAHGLTGRLVTDPTLAARTGAFDVGANIWSSDLLSVVGLDPGQLPPVTTRPYTMLPAVAGQLGLPAPVPVLVAGHDHLVSSYAAGVRNPGETADSLGTAEALVTVAASPPGLDAAGTGLSWNRFPGGDDFALLSGFPDSGRLLDWFCGRFLDHGGYDRFEALARSARRPTGIIVEPYLHGRVGPLPDPRRRLRISGLAESHGLADLAAAMLEGACYQARWVAEEQSSAADCPLGRITALGGPTRSETWMAIKAAVSPRGMRLMPVPDAVGLGAAMLAGAAIGLPIAVPELTSPTVAAEVVDDYDIRYRRDFLTRVRQPDPRENFTP